MHIYRVYMKYLHTRTACVSYVENRKLYIISYLIVTMCTALLDRRLS